MPYVSRREIHAFRLKRHVAHLEFEQDEICSTATLFNLSSARERFTNEQQWKDYTTITTQVGELGCCTAAHIVGAILRRRIVFVREGRGLLANELSIHTFDLETTATQLFKFKNGDEKQYNKLLALRAAFHHFFPKYTPDVLFQQLPSKGNESDSTISGVPKIIYRGHSTDGPYEIDVDRSSGGMNDVLMLLMAMHSGDASVIVLDEISRSLHSTLKQLLSQVIMNSNKSIIMVTHDTEMVSESTIPYVVRLQKNKLKGTFQLPAISPDGRTQFWKWICDPQRLSCFFARGTLFVEGESDVRFFKALFSLILQNAISVPGIDLTTFHFLWEIIPLIGSGNSEYALKLMNDWKDVPYMVILDWDTFIKSTKKEQPAPNKPVMKVRLTWDKVDWACRTNSVLHKAGFQVLDKQDKPNTWQEMYEAFNADEKFKNIFVWPMNVFDIEGVAGLKKKKDLSNMPFADLQILVKDIFSPEKIGGAGALVEFIKRLVKLHEENY